MKKHVHSITTNRSKTSPIQSVKKTDGNQETSFDSDSFVHLNNLNTDFLDFSDDDFSPRSTSMFEKTMVDPSKVLMQTENNKNDNNNSDTKISTNLQLTRSNNSNISNPNRRNVTATTRLLPQIFKNFNSLKILTILVISIICYTFISFNPNNNQFYLENYKSSQYDSNNYDNKISVEKNSENKHKARGVWAKNGYPPRFNKWCFRGSLAFRFERLKGKFSYAESEKSSNFFDEDVENVNFSKFDDDDENNNPIIEPTISNYLVNDDAWVDDLLSDLEHPDQAEQEDARDLDSNNEFENDIDSNDSILSYADKAKDQENDNDNIIELVNTDTNNNNNNNDNNQETDFSDIEEKLNKIANGDFDEIHKTIEINQKNLNTGIFMLDHKFNFDKDDILVYLHMQKTGGTTFGRHLVDNLRRCIKIKGYKRRECQRDLSNTLKNPREKLDLRTSNNRDVWILSRLSTGWLCGLHADYTELKNCINKKLVEFIGIEKTEKINQYWVTNLRNPEDRYVSEWRHVVRGATWKQSILQCNRVPYYDRCFYGRCYTENWINVTLSDFNKCPYNLASNRQTRMLGDLEFDNIDCYNNIFPIDLKSPTYHYAMRKLLASAKYNLMNRISYFMLLEYQRLSQYLFEKTFGVTFSKSFTKKENTVASSYLKGTDDDEQQKNLDEKIVNARKLTVEEVAEIKALNQYDIQLYRYAVKLFFQRIKALRLREMQESSFKNENDK